MLMHAVAHGGVRAHVREFAPMSYIPTLIGERIERTLNRTLLDKTKQDRMRIFKGILFFKDTNNTKTNKSLSGCQLGASRRMCAGLTYKK